MTRVERNFLSPQEIADLQIRRRKQREYVERKIAHWARFGTPAEINPLTGAASMKWKLEADKRRAKKLLETCDRHCKRDHYRRAGKS